MRRFWYSLVVALSATAFMMIQSGIFAQHQLPGVQGSPGLEAQKPEGSASVTLTLDKTSLNNGGTVAITGTAPPGRPVYVEVWAEDQVRASRFDSEPDKETGKRPYVLYMTHQMPAMYRILVPKELQGKLDEVKKQGKGWSYSQALKDLDAEAAYSAPAKAKIERYQATLMGSVVGSRGELLPAMDEKENRKRSMQLVKARFRTPGKVFAANVEVKPDGAFAAKLNIDSGSAPGNYRVRAVAGKDASSEPVTIENKIAFPYLYLSNAGTSLNFFGPFLLTLAIAIFGVLMGAGGGFILNPLLVSIWPLPHTIVAGTVMPTVLFSQASGIYNYSKIKFISWKLGVTIGLAMVLGGFIGPKLTELITLDQFKFVFGWILIILAGLMFWQTTSGYLARNKKEQAILREFKKKAEESARRKASK
ncbi:MAG: sulfite exporter TauE/SafE family protein [Deltaproteobacteria bacterium]|nr:sulfite exporter TauE/SafE family protein [Deltaproteobacteria bacterium]